MTHLDILVSSDPHGSPQRLCELGQIVSIRPWHRAPDGTWMPPTIDSQPLSLAGHRDGDTVEILGPCCPPAGAEDLEMFSLAKDPWFLVRCRSWHRSAEGEIVRDFEDIPVLVWD